MRRTCTHAIGTCKTNAALKIRTVNFKRVGICEAASRRNFFINTSASPRSAAEKSDARIRSRSAQNFEGAKGRAIARLDAEFLEDVLQIFFTVWTVVSRIVAMSALDFPWSPRGAPPPRAAEEPVRLTLAEIAARASKVVGVGEVHAEPPCQPLLQKLRRNLIRESACGGLQSFDHSLSVVFGCRKTTEPSVIDRERASVSTRLSIRRICRGGRRALRARCVRRSTFTAGSGDPALPQATGHSSTLATDAHREIRFKTAGVAL